MMPHETLPTSPPAPGSTASDSPGSDERATLANIVAEPEPYLDRMVTVRGWAGVCPDLCEGIKLRCGTVPPSEGPCTGHVALAFEQPSGVQVRCAAESGRRQNALAVGLEDDQFACRGHCDAWACPAVELGRAYEVTARLGRFLDPEGHYRYVLASDTLRKVDDTDAGAAPREPPKGHVE